MKRGFFQVILLATFVLILLRLFPVVAGLAATASMSLVRFWWLILFLALVVWLIWVFRKRNAG